VAKAGGALGVAVAAFAFAGCSADPIPMPVPAMQLVAPSTLPAPQDIVVPMPVPVPTAPPAAPAAPTQGRVGAVKTGKPYQVAGNWYYPTSGAGYDQQGIASWYGPNFNGKSTANGEIYNMNHLSAAHPTLPLPSYVQVTNTDNGRTLVVRVNDRGPYKHGRILDLSKRAAHLLGVMRFGTAPVRVRFLKMAPLVGGDAYADQFLAKQPWYQEAQAGGEDGLPAVPSPLKIRAGKGTAWQTLMQPQ
jgi:rare lipoprotein A (peptidoglycan hydrolase)